VCVILRFSSEARKRVPSGGKVSTPWDDELSYNCFGHFVFVCRDLGRVCTYEGCKMRCQTFFYNCGRALCVDRFKEIYGALTKRPRSKRPQ
jgi:hypothetical protein